MEDPKASVNESKGENPQNNYNDETQVEENKENIINNTLPFKYLEKDNAPERIIFEGEEKINIFEQDKGKYDQVICILLKDDLRKSSEMLENTLNSIYANRDTFDSLSISTSTTLICIFINEIKGYSLFNKDEFIQIKKEKNSINTCLYLKTHKEGYNSNTLIYVFTKPNYLNSVEALKHYYLGIVPQIKLENKILFSSIITGGVVLNPTSLKKLILNSYYTDNKWIKGVSVGQILSRGEGLFSMVEQYERLHFNIYDMNFFGASSVFPVSSLFNTIAIDEPTLNLLKNYYKNVVTNSSIDYHDYNLGLYLNENNKNVVFVSDEVLGELNYNELSYLEYQEIWVNRYSGYYGNYFKLLKSFTVNCSFFKIIFLFFHIIGMMFEFIYPALSTMVIYAIFYEAFDSYDYRIASFFTMLYVCMLTASGMCSLVSNNPKELRLANLFLYIFMEIYYVFILICSIVAMDNINKNEKHDSYKFNKAAISCIIIFTFIPYIIPMLTKFNLTKILNMFTYIGFGASCSTSNFLMAKIWNSPSTTGGSNIEERKSIVLIFFFLFNLFVGFLSAYNYTRKKRANSVMGLGIIFLIYNFFRMLAIISKIVGGKNTIDPIMTSKLIDNIKIELGKGEENDLRSEEKSFKKSSQLYNSGGNNDYENNNNNINYDD